MDQEGGCRCGAWCGACLSPSFQPEVGLSLCLSSHSLLPWLPHSSWDLQAPSGPSPSPSSPPSHRAVDSSLIHSLSSCLSSTGTSPPPSRPGAHALRSLPRHLLLDLPVRSLVLTLLAAPQDPRTDLRPLTCPFCTKNACPAVTLTTSTTSRAGILFSIFAPPAPGTEVDIQQQLGYRGRAERGTGGRKKACRRQVPEWRG